MSGAPDLSAAGRLAQEGDEPRFLAAMFAPEAARERLFALIAFNCELAKIPLSVSEPMLGEIRLAWWREAVEEMLERGAARAHEAMTALADAHAQTPLAAASLNAMIDARLIALGDGPLSDEATLDGFLGDTGGAYHRLAMLTMGGDAAAQEVAALAGWAEGAGRLIAAIPASMPAGTPEDEVVKRIKTIAAEGAERLAAARKRSVEVRRRWRAPLLSVHMAARAFKVALRSDFTLAAAFEPSPFQARAALLARAAAGRF